MAHFGEVDYRIFEVHTVRILIVEDDSKTATFVAKGLRQAGYAVDVTGNGEDGLHLISEEPYDAAVVDIMLPKLDGVSLVERVRQAGNRTPILFLSAKRSVDDRVRGLQSGADDYLVKPFAFVELLARMQALIRRATDAADPTRLSAGPVTIDLRRRAVTRDGKSLEFQPREFSLLEYLMRNAGKVVSKTMIIEHVWDYNFDPGTNVVEASICRLRNKLNEGFDRPLIKTIRGVGYLFEDP